MGITINDFEYYIVDQKALQKQIAHHGLKYVLVFWQVKLLSSYSFA